jgi:putative oxidoreductase
MKTLVLLSRTSLAGVYLIFGLDFFFHFMHLFMHESPSQGKPSAYLVGLDSTGYFFPLLKAVEMVSGLCLLVNRFTPLFLVVIFPVTLNIFLYHAFLAPSGIPLGGFMLVCNVFLGVAYSRYYKGVLAYQTTLE